VLSSPEQTSLQLRNKIHRGDEFVTAKVQRAPKWVERAVVGDACDAQIMPDAVGGINDFANSMRHNQAWLPDYETGAGAAAPAPVQVQTTARISG
jgi:hypothetical protein